MAKVEFGCRVETGVADYEITASQAKLAEDLGFDSIWIRDHVAVPDTTSVAECLECFTTLAGLARDTKRVKIGSLVTCNPALVAKMGATIDVMSHGRFQLGLGAGQPKLDREFARYGWPDDTSNGDRVRAVGEAVQLIKKMWTEPSASFQGRYYSITDAICEPRPVSKPHPPIVLGGHGEQIALPNAVKYADGWNSTMPPEFYKAKVEVVNRLCEENGRDPASLTRLTNQVIIIDEPEKAEARRRRMIESMPTMPTVGERAVVGRAELVAERVQEFIDLGSDVVIIYMWERDIEAQRQTMQAFAEEVMPLFR